jgi:peptidoglycan/LPS O-acetylase OafA/YrhL
MSREAFSYRPDIDGLRAVAVGAVLIFHAFPKKLPGGFVGVDIFFVISGFLITGIILKELESGKFTYTGFYARRIRRIFPALALVLAATLLVGWATLAPGEFRELSKHTVGGAGFVSNLILWRESGYFDPVGQSKPLLHLWSLGIEEQFYIGWPLLLAALFRRTRKILPAVGLFALVSFCFTIATVSGDPVSAYYSPATRIWELLIGAGLLSGEEPASVRGPGE